MFYVTEYIGDMAEPGECYRVFYGEWSGYLIKCDETEPVECTDKVTPQFNEYELRMIKDLATHATETVFFHKERYKALREKADMLIESLPQPDGQ